jgi:hypothetical protein
MNGALRSGEPSDAGEDASQRAFEILRQAKCLAQEYYRVTGKPLGVTGEVAEYECARLLELELAPARTPGYDAIRPSDGKQLQIKGRRVLPGSKPGQRVPKIDVSKAFDAVLLVLLDENFDATAIYEAERVSVVETLAAPGSRARNDRGMMAISKFKAISRKVWPREHKPMATLT